MAGFTLILQDLGQPEAARPLQERALAIAEAAQCSTIRRPGQRAAAYPTIGGSFLPARGPVLVLDQDAVVDLGDTALRRNAALMSFLVSRPLGAEVSVISTSMPSTPARSR